MARTITTSTTGGVTLTGPTDTPLGVLSGVTVSNDPGSAILGALPGYYAISNAGAVLSTGTTAGGGNGIALAGGGSVANLTGARIAGYGFGVSIAGTGSLANQGTIAATRTLGPGYSYIGGQFIPVSAGAYLGGGSVSNAQGGVISGVFEGVALGGGGTLINAGSVGASATANSVGLLLPAGGALTNLSGGVVAGGNYGILGTGAIVVSNQANATLAGSAYGVFGFRATGSVTNLGTINGGRFTGVYLGKGGTITNLTGAGTGYIAGGLDGVLVQGGAATVTNQGTIRNQTLFTTQTYVFGAVILANGGGVTNSGSIISGSHGVRIAATPGTVVNSGLISSARTVLGGAAVNLTAGGSVSNSGTIRSSFYGVAILNDTGTVTNSGTIFSNRTQAGAGIALVGGGSATNAAGGFITGEWIGVQFGTFGQTGTAAAGTLVNQGTIAASDGANGAAVWMHGPGIILNDVNAVIEGDTNGTIVGGPLNGGPAGAFGIVAYYQTTLINRGTIGGTNFAFDAANGNTAISVGNLIEMAPGAKFTGAVKGAARASDAALSTLELLSGASAGVVTNFGTTVASAGHIIGYVNIGHVAIDSGARWTLGGTVSASTRLDFAPGGSGALTLANPTLVQGTITGFGAGETLSLAGLTDVTGVTLSASGNVLTVTESAGPGLTLHFDPAQSFAGKFAASTAAGATNLTLACFAAGTAIRTDAGPIAVEDLRAGMRALTLRGEAREIVWIGRRGVDCARHPDPASVWPVRVRADAFGPGTPSRDLWLSPDHAVFVEGALIPVRHLVNGDTIQRVAVPAVTYFHIELPAHDVILAEDLPVESFLASGDRDSFADGEGPVRLFPDFGARAWEMAGCAPLIVTGPVLELARARLARNAAAIAADVGRGISLPVRRGLG